MSRKEEFHKDTTSDIDLLSAYIFGKKFSILDSIRFWISKKILPKSAFKFYNILESKLCVELSKMSNKELDRISILSVDIVIRD